MRDAVFVMWQREIKTFFRSKYRILGSIVQPLLYLISFGFGLGPMFEQAGNGSYIRYLVPGIIGMTILFSGIMNGMSLIADKRFGFLKETFVAPVSRTHILLGRCLGGATTSTFKGLIILFMSFFLGFRIQSWFLFVLGVLFMFMISLLFTLVGTSIASKVDDMQAFPVVINFLIMPMFFLSGALFPIEEFPFVIKLIANVNPMSYAVSLLQFAFNGVGNLLLNVIVVFVLFFVFVWIGTSVFKKIEP